MTHWRPLVLCLGITELRVLPPYEVAYMEGLKKKEAILRSSAVQGLIIHRAPGMWHPYAWERARLTFLRISLPQPSWHLQVNNTD